MRFKTIISYSIIFFLLVGCSKSYFLPIENGFGYGGHSEGFPDRKTWAGLQYRDSTGKTTDVWGYLSNTSPVVQITNNLAVFVGGVYDDGRDRFSERLMVFEAPNGPPMDITDQILQRYCAGSGFKRTDIVKDSFASLTKTNDAVKIDFVTLKEGTIADGIEVISWRDIEGIMADVKKNGKLRKEKWAGFEYLRKE